MSQRNQASPSEPWHGFFRELDTAATEEVDLQCVGGFVVTELYGLARPTADVDLLSIAPVAQRSELLKMGGEGSQLHQKYGVYLQYVGGIVSLPYDYDERLVPMFQGAYKHLRFFALDPYDLVLSKLERNQPKDRQDVLFLARAIPLDLNILKQRYPELRPQLFGVKENFDANFELWLEMIEEDRRRS